MQPTPRFARRILNLDSAGVPLLKDRSKVLPAVMCPHHRRPSFSRTLYEGFGEQAWLLDAWVKGESGDEGDRWPTELLGDIHTILEGWRTLAREANMPFTLNPFGQPRCSPLDIAAGKSLLKHDVLVGVFGMALILRSHLRAVFSDAGLDAVPTGIAEAGDKEPWTELVLKEGAWVYRDSVSALQECDGCNSLLFVDKLHEGYHLLGWTGVPMFTVFGHWSIFIVEDFIDTFQAATRYQLELDAYRAPLY